jgi:hypothetical protein
MENLNNLQGKKRAAGEELVYNQIIGEGKPQGEGNKGKNKKEKYKNKRDKKPNKSQEDNENNVEGEEEESKPYNKGETAKSFNTYRDLKSEKFEFYYRVSTNFHILFLNIEPISPLFYGRSTIPTFC